MSRRLVLALVVIVGTVLLAQRCQARAGARGALAAGASSVPIYLAGVLWCHAAPAPDGWYTAAHCTWGLRGRRLALVGVGVPPWSVDPARDLAHFEGAARSIPLRVPALYDYAVWQSSQGGGTMQYAGSLDQLIVDYPGQEYQVWCRVDGAAIRHGDSGTGLFAATDGALMGVVTNRSDAPVPWCWGASAYAVGVP